MCIRDRPHTEGQRLLGYFCSDLSRPHVELNRLRREDVDTGELLDHEILSPQCSITFAKHRSNEGHVVINFGVHVDGRGLPSRAREACRGDVRPRRRKQRVAASAVRAGGYDALPVREIVDTVRLNGHGDVEVFV